MDSDSISKNKLEKFNVNSGIALIKSDYFLNKIFDILPKNKYLQIIKCNNKIKKRLKITINDYKEYSEIYSTIIIEMKIKRRNDEYDKFINLSNKDMEHYYHIIDNDSKKEIKIDNIMEYNNISNIKINIDYHVKSFENLFRDCEFQWVLNQKGYFFIK